MKPKLFFRCNNLCNQLGDASLAWITGRPNYRVLLATVDGLKPPPLTRVSDLANQGTLDLDKDPGAALSLVDFQMWLSICQQSRKADT